jgi:hypothetical protein
MARLIRRLDKLEEPPGAEVSQRAMEFLTDAELRLIIAWGRRALDAQAGPGGTPPTKEEGQALARWESLCDDIRDGYL